MDKNDNVFEKRESIKKRAIFLSKTLADRKIEDLDTTIEDGLISKEKNKSEIDIILFGILLAHFAAFCLLYHVISNAK